MCRDFSRSMENSTRETLGLIQELDCVEYAVPIMTSIFFRFSTCLHLLLALLGSAFLIRVLFFRIPNVAVHKNLKIISYVFAFNLLVNCFFIIGTQIHVLAISFTFTEPCDAFLPKNSYRFIHYFIAWTSFAQTWFKTAFLVERGVATKKAGEYETWTCKLGWSLTGFAILFSTVEFLYTVDLFSADAFDEQEISYLLFPKPSRGRYNHVLLFSIILSILGLTACCFLYKYNKMEKAKKIGCRLSKRYQYSENIRATEFVLCVSIITTSLFIISLTIVLSLRFLQQLTMQDDVVAFSIARSASYPMPLLSLLLPVCLVIIRSKQSKKLEIMEKCAEAGEYDKILQKQWEK